MKIFLLLILGIVISVQLFAQAAIGTWKDYLSFSNGKKLAIQGEKVYCATEGGIFYFDTEDNSVNKVGGLSDFGIKTIAANDDEDLLMVAYTNSNIDILKQGTVYNLSDIKRKSISADKSINNITFHNNGAYISCGFGIVVVNLERNEIKDTYFIGDDGGMLAVYDVEFYQGMIWAATQKGLFKAPETGVNLLDYSNWSEESNVPHAGGPFTQLEVHSGNLVANFSPESGDDQSYRYNGDIWSNVNLAMYDVLEMKTYKSYLCYTGGGEVVFVDETNTQAWKINTYVLNGETVSSMPARSTAIDNNGVVWIADYVNGLVRYDGSNFEAVYPNGPVDNEVFSVTINGSDLWVTPGGRSDSWNNRWMQPRYQRLRAGEWTNISKTEIPELNGFWDLVCLAVDPSDANHIFAGSWGGGLLEFRNDELVERYTNQNSPLQTVWPQDPSEPYVRIGGLDFDSEGNLWITNWSVSKNNLHKLSSSGEWESFTMSQAAGLPIGAVIVNGNDDKWVLVPSGNDVYVVNQDGSQRMKLAVTSYFASGNDEYTTRMNDVYSIAEDLDGAIWIGTSQGVAVYNNPSRIWSTSPYYASQPGLELNDGIYHPLLSTETVTAIAVDGANRKWLGTSNSGVFLVSETGEQEVEHFTAENSPLLSNNIKTIAINEKSGEVFFGTSEGLISYQGDANGGNEDYSGVYVYPNPVRETYDGPVTITGLIANTDIKITDISGNLVYKTTSLGGQAVWDGNNLNGNRVKTGVYLVFCNDKNGEETHIAKLLFIH